jgi:ubiquitin-activating enzyme E1 C
VLIVGAGGLGCELLKDLALSGFQDIHVIDLDNVDVSNLNRQFLFRMGDVDKPKAEVAAKFIMRRCPGVKVQYHTKPIQEFSPKWYKQFDIVIAGLDNIEARQWLNQTLVNLVEFNEENGEVNEDTVIPLIDGGTEGFQGQARVFLPRITSCFECSLPSMPPQTGFAV